MAHPRGASFGSFSQREEKVSFILVDPFVYLFFNTSAILPQPRMLIPKKNRRMIYEHLFKEGVLVAKKDFNLPKHPEIDVPNLQVIKAMQVRALGRYRLGYSISLSKFMSVHGV